MEFDIAKVPGLKEVVINRWVVSLFWDKERRMELGIYCPDIRDCRERIAKFETLITEIESGKDTSVNKYYLQQYKRDKLIYENIYLPLSLQIETDKQADPEVKYMTEEEHGKTCGNQFGKRVRGEDKSLEEMGLKPGDRFINNFDGEKYIYQYFDVRREQFGFGYDIVKAINERTGQVKSIKDSKHYQKLPGQGKVEPHQNIIYAVLIGCQMEYFDNYEFVENCMKRYMRQHKLNVLSGDDINAIIKLIKEL